jgi:hypothetical protein
MELPESQAPLGSQARTYFAVPMRISTICTQEQSFPLCRRHSRRARTARHTRNTWQPRAARASRQGPLLSRLPFKVLCTRLHAQGVITGNLTFCFAVLQALTERRVCPAHPGSTDLPDHQAAQARTGPFPLPRPKSCDVAVGSNPVVRNATTPHHRRTHRTRAHTHNSSTNINSTTSARPHKDMHARIAALVRRFRCSTLYAHAQGEIFVWRRVGSGDLFRSVRRSGHTWCPRCPRRPGRARPCGEEWHPRQSRPSRLAPSPAHICAQCGANSGGRTDRLLDEVALIDRRTWCRGFSRQERRKRSARAGRQEWSARQQRRPRQGRFERQGWCARSSR